MGIHLINHAEVFIRETGYLQSASGGAVKNLVEFPASAGETAKEDIPQKSLGAESLF